MQVDDLGVEEARSLVQPAMTYVRGQLRGRLTARLARSHRRWLHPTSGRQPGDDFLEDHIRRADRTRQPVRGCPELGQPIGRPQRKCPAASMADCRPPRTAADWPHLPDTGHIPLPRRHVRRLR
jgi:hypothetical protein